MNDQEKQLIEQLKKKPGVTVKPGRFGGSVVVYEETATGLSIQSVWLGRSRSIPRLKELAAS